MADYDPSSIPILDDIIAKGDTEKAANRHESDLLESLEPEQDQALDVATQNAEAVPEPEIKPEMETGLSSQDVHTEKENLYAPESAPVSDESQFNTNADHPSDEITEEPPIAIEKLTEDILASIMPDMERLLRDRIRLALEQQRQNDDSQATDTTPGS
jgi:hypothetical protein